MKNIEFKIKNIDKKDGFNSLFGYIENEDYAIYSYIQKEKLSEDDTLLETVINISIEEFQNNPEYSIKNIKNIIYNLNEKIIEVNIDNIDFSMLYIVTDYNSLVYMSCGSLSFNLIRNDNVYMTNVVDTNFIGINKSFYVNTNKENILINKNDIFMIYSKNLSEVINIYEDLDDMEIDLEKSYVLSSLKIVEILDRSLFIKKSKFNFFKYLMIITLLILAYIFVIKLYISFQYTEIDKLDNKFRISMKDKKLSKAKEYLNEEIIILRNLDKKYIFMNKKDSINKLNKKTNKEDILDKINLVEKYLENIEKEKGNIKNRKFENSLKEYIKLDNILDIFPDYFISFKDEVVSNIEDINRLIDNKKKEDEFEFLEDKLFSSIKNLKEIIEVYKTSSFNINISDLEDRLNGYIKDAEKYKLKLEEDLLNIKILQSENITLAEKKLIEVKSKLEALEDENKLKEINDMLLKVSEEIKYNKEELEKNFEYGISAYENKNYDNSIEYFKIALEVADKLNDFERIKEIKGRIKYINKKIIEKRNVENVVVRDPYKEENIKKQKLKSIMLSIEKGDEYLKNNEFKNVYMEYKRVIEMSSDINLDKNIKYKTQKKIEYIKKKLNKKWWEVWK